ncbi:hypothetical protein SAMN04488005_3111 [Yoonia tamlensis]|uniref:Uncharacterized protein n=1 Tax=Yoonia tamlensis TaxID=390270 RepID=A0A1I6HXZ8_9RHOB|nr:hypothetical protein [Yoonia tamlensis]SFR59362.1 hypothetical protein SAMN04488005_3111 [Yoonia tamlensis]
MNSSDLSIADRLTQLIAQRESFQIGEYEFETQKRAALQLSPAGLHPVVRNLLAFLIVNCASLGFAIAFPDYAKLALIVIGILLAIIVTLLTSSITHTGGDGSSDLGGSD